MADDVPNSDIEGAEEEEKNSRSSLWLVLAAIVAIIILLWLLMSCGSDLFTSDSTSETAAITVPDVVGMHRDEAVETLSEAGFDVDIRKTPSDDEPAGTVLRQSPPAGTQSSYGIAVLIEIADGPVTPDEPLENQVPDTVPYLLGALEDDALHKIEMAGYQGAVGYVSSGISLPGKVLNQYPAAGAEAPLGSVVHVQIALGDKAPPSVAVPSVEGLSVEAAKSRISASGLEPFPIERPLPTPYMVAEQQWPESGEVIDGGSFVYFIYGIEKN